VPLGNQSPPLAPRLTQVQSVNVIDPDETSDPDDGTNMDLDPAVTPELFRLWRSPRFGRSNPERMNNPVWEWLIRSKLHAFTANEKLHGPDSFDAGPCWCFARFGQSSTQLADGRVVLIAGEHEDHYDPDFYIYNDVVVRHPDGGLDIFGYPHDVFPPTDFHSATLADNRIIIIGSLGYPEERKPGTTPVRFLDLKTMSVGTIETSGTPPGWIHKHTATLSEDGSSILLQHGLLDRGGEWSRKENIDDWRLHLKDWRWERLTNRRWPRWEIRRQDRKPNHLWQIQQARWSLDVESHQKLEKQMEELEVELGNRPNLDLAVSLYNPPIPHENLPAKSEEEYRITRISVEGVVVRYVEDMHGIQMTVEGDLPKQTVQALASDLCEKLAALENTPAEMKEI
jgi:hypothetical protein